MTPAIIVCPHDWFPIGGFRERCDRCGAVRRRQSPWVRESPKVKR